MEAYGTGQTVLLGAVPILMYRHGQLSDRSSIISGELLAGGNMFTIDWSAPEGQKATLDSLRTLSRFLSCRPLAPKFQHSPSAVNLGIYLGDPDPPL